jgi:hypothetical protein
MKEKVKGGWFLVKNSFDAQLNTSPMIINSKLSFDSCLNSDMGKKIDA